MNLEVIQKNINYNFKNLDLLQNSLVHKSFLKERSKHSSITNNNERLEFLGDAVLQMITTEYLFSKLESNEGILTLIRSSLVNSVNLAIVANELGLATNIYLSKGEGGLLGIAKDHIIADALEAIIGAMYLDGGYTVTKDFVINHIFKSLEEIVKSESYRDPKTLLQEYLQEKTKITPQYKIIETSGKDHQKEFWVGVYKEEEELGQGRGNSKQKAETEAAKQALEFLKNLQEDTELNNNSSLL